MISVSKCTAFVSLVSLIVVGSVASGPASAIPFYKSHSIASDGNYRNGITSLTVHAPTDVVQGDLLIAGITIANNGSMGTMPAGWNLLVPGVSTSNGYGFVYTKTATGNEPKAYVFGVNANKGASAVIADYSSSESTVSIDSYSSSMTAWNVAPPYNGSIPGITTNASSTKLITMLLGRLALNTGYTGYNTFTIPSAYEFCDYVLVPTQMSGGFKDMYQFTDETITPNGSTGSRSVTETVTITPQSSINATGWGLLIALHD